MRNKVIIGVLIVVILFLFVLPVNIIGVSDGGTMIFTPIMYGWYEIWDYNIVCSEEPPMLHDDPNYHPPKNYYIKGTRIEFFGQVIYENKYEVHS